MRPIRRIQVDTETAAAYLRRIDVPVLVPAHAEGIRTLHRAHLIAVPFENLSIHLSEPISLAEEDLVAKIVGRRRGGFCYELNGLFALLLEALGARVTRVAARAHGDGGLGHRCDLVGDHSRGIPALVVFQQERGLVCDGFSG